MTTAYTSLLGLALPVTSELSGTWGDTVNTAITSLLDTAVAGTTSITTDADITLSTTTGASNQARQAIILWNPASGTVTRNITAPAQSKMYVVINASGGTQSIVIRGAGPTTGVTIAKGESATVAWNGSDFVKVSSSGGAITFTDLTVTGNTILGDAAADTLTVNATSTFNAPVSFAGLVRLPSTGRSAAAALTTTAPAFLYGVASTYTDTTSSGTIAAMAPFYSIAQPTLSTSNVTTYTTAATLYIANAPVAGGSATITNPYALYVAAGASYFGGAVTYAGGINFNGNVTVGDSSADTLTINSTITSNLIFTDNTYDIGASGATRPRSLYLGTSVITPLIDTTNLEVTNIKALDGTSAASVANSTGVISLTANPILSGGTANGVTYLNGSKVVTSGSALTFDGTNLGVGTATPSTFIQALGGAASAANVINWNARLSTGATGSSSFGAVGTGIYLDSFTNSGTQPIAGVSSYLLSGGSGGAATNFSGGITFWVKNGANASITRAATIDQDGYFGLGVTTVGLPFDVAKTGVQVGSTTAYTIGRFREGVPNKGVTLGYDSGSQTGILLAETTGTSSNLAFWTYQAGVSGWAERVRINSNGILLVGTTTETNNIRLGQKLALVNTSNYGGASIVGYEGTSAGTRPLFDINRSRGTTDGSMTAVTAEDYLGSMLFRGADGTNFLDSSMVSGEVDGTVSTGNMPGRLSFHTAGATGGVVERMRINSTGTVGVNVVPNSWYKGSSGSTVQVYRASMYSDSSNSGFFGNNYLLNASGTEQFMANGYANRMLIDTGVFKFQVSSTSNSSGGVANISTMKNAATLDVNGNMILTGSIFPAVSSTRSISTSGWSANTFYEVVPPGTFTNGDIYWVTYRWDHISGGPYIIAGAFMWVIVNTNGTGADNTYTPLGSSHTGGGYFSFRSRAGNSASTGLEVTCTAINNGTLVMNFYRFA